MAARNVKTEPFEGMDKLSSATLKRNPKNMDLNKNDLLRLLGYLEGELQARDITIAALKAEKAKQLFNQAKYGRFGLSDPFLALQRDSDTQRDTTFDEAAVKAMYDNQLTQLENLIATQRRAQQRNREQLAAVEKRYHKVLAELEEEKRKHAADTEQGDNVTYMLEKDRERLKQELEFEKAQVKKLEKEIKRLSSNGSSSQASSPKDGEEVSPSEDNVAPHRHKQMTLFLLKDRSKLTDKLLLLQHRNRQLENTLKTEQSKTKNMAEGLSSESQKSLQMEAEMEKHLADCDTNRTALAGRLAKEESKNETLRREIENLKHQFEQLSSSSSSSSTTAANTVEIKSTQRQGGFVGSMMDNRVGGSGSSSTVKSFRGTPPPLPPAPHTPPEVRRAGGVVVRESPERDPASPRVPQPTGTGKAVIYAPQSIVTGSKSPGVESPRTVSVPERPVPAEKPADLSARMAAMSAGTASSQQGPTMFTTPSGTRITVAVGGGAAGARKPLATQRPVPPPVPPNKPQCDATDPPPPPSSSYSSSSPSSSSSTVTKPVNEILPGPELADLQQLLVSMVTGTSESDTSSVEDLSSNESSYSSSSSYPSSVTPCIIPRTPIRPVTLPRAPEDVRKYPLHVYAASGDVERLKECVCSGEGDVNQAAQPDASTPIHIAAEHGQTECLSYLLEKGGSTNALKEDHSSPLHVASAEGHVSCLKLLLEHGGFVNQPDTSGWTPLHWAAYNGHAACCTLLKQHNARLDAQITANGWTSLHAAVHMGHTDSMAAMLSDGSQDSASSVINVADNEGWTVGHLAAARTDKECLSVLLHHMPGSLDLHKQDKQGRTVLDVASEQCKQLIHGEEEGAGGSKQVTVSISLPAEGSHINIGRFPVPSTADWSELEENLSTAFLHHITAVSAGLRTRRISKAMEASGAESPEGATTHFSLGLTMNSIKHYSIGVHSWSPGTPHVKSPYEILTDNDASTVTVNLFDLDEGCQDALAYEILIPVQTLQNYLRLVEQYKNLILYGPSGTGKSLLARKLAQCVQGREAQQGNVAEIHVISLDSSVSRLSFISMLVEKGCLLSASTPVPSGQSPVLVLDNLGQVDVAEVLSDILPIIENRGPQHCIRVNTDDFSDGPSHGSSMMYLHPRCFILGTMDRSRWTGLALPVQQKFRWLHFRTDQEPLKTLLSRHLYRRLVHRHRGVVPAPDDMMFRCVEWVVCVWFRVNEGLTKLSYQDYLFGPAHFLSCPVEANKPKGILRWLSLLWNHKIAPVVSAAVVKTSSSNNEGEQHKLANTALYVLMQRAVVSSCPLTGQEKERYLSSFHGSNELDIKMKSSEKRPNTPATRTRTPSKKLHKAGFPWTPSKDNTESTSKLTNDVAPTKQPDTPRPTRHMDNANMSLSRRADNSALTPTKLSDSYEQSPMKRIDSVPASPMKRTDVVPGSHRESIQNGEAYAASGSSSISSLSSTSSADTVIAAASSFSFSSTSSSGSVVAVTPEGGQPASASTHSTQPVPSVRQSIHKPGTTPQATANHQPATHQGATHQGATHQGATHQGATHQGATTQAATQKASPSSTSPQVVHRPAPPRMNVGYTPSSQTMNSSSPYSSGSYSSLYSSPSYSSSSSHAPSFSSTAAIGASGPVESHAAVDGLHGSDEATSPGGSVLSPNAHMLFGNSIFAVSGIPSGGNNPVHHHPAVSPAAPRFESPRVNNGAPMPPVGSMPQGPGRGASPAPARVTKGSTPPRVPQRTSSIPDGTGSELSHSSPQLYGMNSNVNASPGVSRLPAPAGMMLNRNPQILTVKRPTSLPPNSPTSPSLQHSPRPVSANSQNPNASLAQQSSSTTPPSQNPYHRHSSSSSENLLARRALSPGPENMYRTAPPAEVLARRAFSPGPDVMMMRGGENARQPGNVRPVLNAHNRNSQKPK